MLEFGHLNCFAHTIPAAAVHGPLYVRVAPLRADGTVGESSGIVRVDSELALASTARRAPEAPPAAAAAPVASVAAPRLAPPRASCVLPVLEPLARTAGAAAIAGVLFGLALAAGWSRRRRDVAALGLAALASAGLAALASAGLAALASSAPWPAWPALAAAAVAIPVALLVRARLGGASRS